MPEIKTIFTFVFIFPFLCIRYLSRLIFSLLPCKNNLSKKHTMETKKRYPSRLQIRFLWLLVTLFATTFVYAQNSNDSIIVDTLASGEPVYNCMKVDQKPEFPGGEEALLTDYLLCPSSLYNNNYTLFAVQTNAHKLAYIEKFYEYCT